MFQSPRFLSILNRTLQWINGVYQAAAIFAFVASLVLAAQWLRLPFVGAFFEQTMVFNGLKPASENDGWSLISQWENSNDHLGNQLVSVAGVEVRSAAEMADVLERFVPGESIPVVMREDDGSLKEYMVALSNFASLPDGRVTQSYISYIIIPKIIGALFLILGVLVFAFRRTESAGRSFSLFASSLSIVTTTLFDLSSTHWFPLLWTFGLAVLGGSLLDLALNFPREFKPIVTRPYLRWSGYAIGTLLTVYAATTLWDYANPIAYFRAWQFLYIFTGLCGLFFIGMMVYHGLAAQSPVVKSQARTVLIGTLMGLSWAIYWLISNPFTQEPFNTRIFLPLVAFPLSLGFTILRFRLLQTDVWLRQGLVYAALTTAVIGTLGLLASGLSLVFASLFNTDNIFFIVGLVFLIVILLNPLRARIESSVDARFFRGQRAYLKSQQDFMHTASSAVDQTAISQALRETLMSTLGPDRTHIYLYEHLNDQYIAMPGPDGRPTSDIRFAANSPLVQYFQSSRIPLYLDGADLVESLRSEESRLTLLGTRLFVRLPGKGRPLGWLALGQRVSGQAYTPQELAYIDNLSEQAAVAIERAQTVSDLERRVSEMNALTRVSQGVNITLSFNDVLELIYAQTAQIIPSTDFHITLYNRPGDYYFYSFSVENRDRREDLENNPLPANYGLAQDVIRRGRPLLTQDYIRECQARNVIPAEEGVYAWIGVPLNAGAETIGALAVGSRDALINYTRGQLDLLQNIADQTAGAIVKSRLLQESERRTRQLTTLNEITRQLTSTLESEPLLRNILENAVSILNCEAGSLFLVDDQTDELIFKVTVGPVATDLLGRRLPPGSGIVGRAVQTRRPVIDNNAQVSGSRHAQTDQQTGFQTRTLLAVPLQVKDRVIGVVEVINRRDGLPFGDDDQNLLTAFAGQAAVAIENARLYTLTDQELAARVEELSVMQRIDRELNASLEMDRALRITLDWAMRQSRADSGLIGMLEEDDLRIMAQQGYGNYLAGFAETPMPLDLPLLRRAVESGQPQRQALEPEMGGSVLPDAHEQIVIPIRREAQVIGLMMLESLTETAEDISFLTRLSDHAAIAIANAQLFNAVQAANIAKSDFVSFVAHELKNPMTSIKGYTELLAGAKVGPITDMQANFLATIRTNVERMSTLVSDLNDNSKIEAGRLRLDFKAMDVPDVIDEVIRSTRRQIEEKKQAIQLQIPEMLPQVWADRIRVGQVLTNLVSNAHKYTPEEGQVIVGAEATNNQWDPEGAARVVHLWVRDTGIGINLEDQQKIFQKFFRSDDQKAREAPGTGLGLNITKSLVEMQGGRIWFESEFRKGTTFHFTIPVAEG